MYIKYFFPEWGWLWWGYTQSTGPGTRDLLFTNKTLLIFRLRATPGPSAWSRPTRRGSTGWPWRTSRGSRRRDRARTSCWGNCEQLQRSARTFCCYLFCKIWSQVTKHDTHIHNDSCSGSDRIQNECVFLFSDWQHLFWSRKEVFSWLKLCTKSKSKWRPVISRGTSELGFHFWWLHTLHTLPRRTKDKNRTKEITRSIVESCWGIFLLKFSMCSKNLDCVVVNLCIIHFILYLAISNWMNINVMCTMQCTYALSQHWQNIVSSSPDLQFRHLLIDISSSSLIFGNFIGSRSQWRD